MELHSKDRTVHCDYCEKQFFGETSQKRHMSRMHRKESGLPEMTHFCDLCGKHLGTKQALMEHKEHQHSNKQPDPKFKCEHCGKQLKQRNSYTKQPDPKFKCEHCGKQLKQR